MSKLGERRETIVVWWWKGLLLVLLMQSFHYTTLLSFPHFNCISTTNTFWNTSNNCSSTVDHDTNTCQPTRCDQLNSLAQLLYCALIATSSIIQLRLDFLLHLTISVVSSTIFLVSNCVLTSSIGALLVLWTERGERGGKGEAVEWRWHNQIFLDCITDGNIVWIELWTVELFSMPVAKFLSQFTINCWIFVIHSWTEPLQILCAFLAWYCNALLSGFWNS